eukprot:XP_765266.1 small nuclear ribonucleoprotein G [Theileria parva strain Muguga]
MDSINYNRKYTYITQFYKIIIKCCKIVHLNGSRHVVGVLRGYDTFMNIVLDNALEVVGEDQVDLGVVVVRGNSILYWECLDRVNTR